MKEVAGLKWGNYVGSPAHPEPSLAWTQSYGSVVATVVSLPTGDVFGLGPCSTLLVMYSKETGKGFFLNFGGPGSIFGDTVYPYFGLCVSLPMNFKARVVLSPALLLACACLFHQ